MREAAETEIRRRLGAYGVGSVRNIRLLVRSVADEPVEAAVVAMESRRGWIVAATDPRLHLARRPWILGRKATRTYEWSLLRDVRTNAAGIELDFGGEGVTLLAAGPHDEAVALAECARRRLRRVDHRGGSSVQEIRELALRKLGRLAAFGQEANIDGLPDRLLPGERVERLAVAKAEFDGLLVLTDQRLLLLEVGLRRADERLWAVDRADILDARIEGGGITVRSSESQVAVVNFQPIERRDEFASVLGRA